MNKLKTVLAFTLVIFIVSFCAPALFGQAPQRGRRPMMQNQPRERLNIPDLTDEQKEQLKNLRENQREVQKQFMEKAEKLHLQINELKLDAAANASEIEKIQDTIFNLRIERMKNAYQHQKEIRKIFTPEQLKKMSALRRPQGNRFMGRGQNRGHRQMSGRNCFFQRNMMRRRR